MEIGALVDTEKAVSERCTQLAGGDMGLTTLMAGLEQIGQTPT
jgi:hypothetical protein